MSFDPKVEGICKVRAHLHPICTQDVKRGYAKCITPLIFLVPRGGIEPPTRGFSVLFYGLTPISPDLPYLIKTIC